MPFGSSGVPLRRCLPMGSIRHKAIEVSHVLIDGNAQFFVFAILVSFYEALHGTGVVEKIEHIDESASVVAYGDVAFFLGGKSFFVLEFSD